MIQIDKGIPMPDLRYGPSRKYPFLEMEVGDSFLAPEGTHLKRMYNTAYYAGQRNGDGRKFAVRNTPEGVRVWRIK